MKFDCAIVGGGLAGHNGLRSIDAHLHSADFVRVRMGVGKPPGGSDPTTLGLFASIGIVKGQPFAPDERMKKIEEFQGGQIAFMNKWKGGAMVLAGLGTVSSYFMGAFEWISKFISMKH